MAKGIHCTELERLSVASWNEWKKTQTVPLDLREAYLAGRDLSGMDLSDCDLSGSDLSDCELRSANFCRCHLSEVDLSGSELVRCDLSEARMSRVCAVDSAIRESWLFGTQLDGAVLTRCRFFGSHFSHASLVGADLTSCDLNRCIFSSVEVSGAHFVGCAVYGMAVWDIHGVPAECVDLRITELGSTLVTVDDLRIAQFIHLLIDNAGVRSVIESITAKVVLLLGRFSASRKGVLDDLRRALRQNNFVPIIFDFERPPSRTYRETVTLLAHLARAIIVDITDALEVRSELGYIAPLVPSTPIIPVIMEGHSSYVTFDDIRRYPWVCDLAVYSTSAELKDLAMDGLRSIVRRAG